MALALAGDQSSSPYLYIDNGDENMGLQEDLILLKLNTTIPQQTSPTLGTMADKENSYAVNVALIQRLISMAGAVTKRVCSQIFCNIQQSNMTQPKETSLCFITAVITCVTYRPHRRPVISRDMTACIYQLTRQQPPLHCQEIVALQCSTTERYTAFSHNKPHLVALITTVSPSLITTWRTLNVLSIVSCTQLIPTIH